MGLSWGCSLQLPEVYLTGDWIGCEEVLRSGRDISRSIPGLSTRVNLLDEMADGDLPAIPTAPAYYRDGQFLLLEKRSHRQT